MRNSSIVCVLIVLCSCTDRDPHKPLLGFWVSADYINGKPFQTLTISTADTNLYGAIPFLIETNQYGSYPYIDPADTIDGHIEAKGPHWEIDFILKPEGDTLVQIYSAGEAAERRMKYVRMDSLKAWREAIFCDLQLQIDLPPAKKNDNLTTERKYFVVDLFLGPIRESLREEHLAIPRDSVAFQVYDVLIGADKLEGYLRNEQTKLDEADRDSIIVVLNADSKIPDEQIHEWVERIKSYNTQFQNLATLH